MPSTTLGISKKETHQRKGHTISTNQQQLEELQKQVKELAEQIEQLQEQISNAQPTTGLLGRWATHPEYGDVLITMDRPLSSSHAIGITYLDMKREARGEFVDISELTFPEQTTRAQDVPAGEAWLVDAHNGNDHHPNTPALKINPNLWVTPARETADENEWHNWEITLIAPLIPVRP